MSCKDHAGEIEERLLGTADCVERALEDLGIEEDPTDVMAEFNTIERCPECDWWVETGELVDEDCEEVPCSGCRLPESIGGRGL